MDDKFKLDIILAKRLCRELKAGNGKAILELYSLHQNLFLRFAMRRLYEPGQSRAQKVLGEFWLKLLDGRALCAYNGRASLRTYLLVILNRSIMDENAGTKKRRERFLHQDNWEKTPASQASPEDEAIYAQRKKILTQTLAALESVSVRDANFVRMRLNGLGYEKMAQIELAGTCPGKKELKKKTNAIKKQVTRPGTGSLAKFKVLLERILKKNGLKYRDMFK